MNCKLKAVLQKYTRFTATNYIMQITSYRVSNTCNKVGIQVGGYPSRWVSK